MNRRPELPANLCQRIDEARTKSGKLYQAGDIEAAIRASMVGWELIPEPKSKWDYYPQSMAASFLRRYTLLGDIENTKKWIEITAQMYDDPNHEDQYVLMLEGDSMYKLGDMDRAYYAFSRIYEIYGRRGFAGEEVKYFKFFMKERERRHVEHGEERRNVQHGEELPDDVYGQVTELSEQGNLLLDSYNPKGAISAWCEALSLLPSPQNKWEAALWLNASIGDAYRTRGELEEARAYFIDALKCPDGHVNPFVLLQLGKTLVDLGDENAGVEYLLRTYMLEAEEIFEEDGARYLQLLRDRKLID